MATKPAPKPFVPTTKRGAELARHIMDIIEEVNTFRRDDRAPERADVKKASVWDQGVWGAGFIKALPPNSLVEVLTVKELAEKNPDYDPEDYADADEWDGIEIALPKGVTCGTAMCFAGWTTNEVGDRMLIDYPLDNVKRAAAKGSKFKNAKRLWNGWDDEFEANKCISSEGVVSEIDERAQELLGLEWEEAHALFAGGNTIETLRYYVEMMEQGKHLVTGLPVEGRGINAETS